MARERERPDRWLRLLVATWAIIGVVVLIAVVGWLLGKVSSALVPLAVAVVVVLVLRGPVHALTRRGWNRTLAVAAMYVIAAGALAVAGVFIIPPVAAQVRGFVQDFPRYYTSAYRFGQDVMAQYREFSPSWLDEYSRQLYLSLGSEFSRWSSGIARGALTVGGRALGSLFSVLLGLVIGFWMLRDLPAIRNELLLLAGPRNRDEADIVYGKVSFALGGYLRGLIIVSFLTGLLATVGLWIAGVPYPLVLGILTGVFNVVPYVGPAITAVVAAMVAAFVNPWLALVAVGVIIGAQQVTDLFITPRVMSEQVDLHPVLVILSLLVGGTLFGFWGLVLAIPVAAAGKGLFVYFFERYTTTSLSSREGALFREKRDPDSPCDPVGEPERTAEPADEETDAEPAEEH